MLAHLVISDIGICVISEDILCKVIRVDVVVVIDFIVIRCVCGNYVIVNDGVAPEDSVRIRLEIYDSEGKVRKICFDWNEGEESIVDAE